MNTIPTKTRRAAALIGAVAIALGATQAFADEATIRKTLQDRLPQLPKIDEVSKTTIPGLYEVRMGSEVVYSDETGDHLIQGSIYDTKAKVDMTKARLDKLSAIKFADLPLKDAFTIKQGDGSRKLVVFADPNCGYCKRLEKDMLALKDVTIYTFLYPILGEDSVAKSRDIWCSPDAAKAWRAWMIEGKTPARSIGQCDTSALKRNADLGQKYRVNATPAVVFEDGSRAPGAVPAEEIERRLKALDKS